MPYGLFAGWIKYLEKFDLVPVFKTEEDIAHWFLPRSSIVSSYVVEVCVCVCELHVCVCVCVYVHGFIWLS